MSCAWLLSQTELAHAVILTCELTADAWPKTALWQPWYLSCCVQALQQPGVQARDHHHGHAAVWPQPRQQSTEQARARSAGLCCLVCRVLCRLQLQPATHRASCRPDHRTRRQPPRGLPWACRRSVAARAARACSTHRIPMQATWERHARWQMHHARCCCCWLRCAPAACASAVDDAWGLRNGQGRHGIHDGPSGGGKCVPAAAAAESCLQQAGASQR